MESTNLTVKRIKITPIGRLRVLTNQRAEAFRKANLVTPEFISGMTSSYEKQTKTLIRSITLGAIYLALMYTAYNGSGVKIAILGVEFSDVSKLLEVCIVLYSFSLFSIGVQHLNLNILLLSIDSIIGSLIPNDEISQGLMKFRYAPIMNFLIPFQRTMRVGSETISPVGVTKVFNAVMITVGLGTFFSVYIIPMIFMLGFVVPSMTTSVVSIGIGFLAWLCSCFLICSFLMLFIPFPYEETIVETLSDK